MSLAETDIADLAAKGLKSSIRERLEDNQFWNLTNVLIRAIAIELRMSREKETSKFRRSNMHAIEYDSDSSTDDNKKVYAAKFV